MLAKNVTIGELELALEKVNAKFDNNIRFKKIDRQGKHVRFTLTVNNSKMAGGRIGHSGKRVAAACWHVHGEFFDILMLEVQPNAVIIAGDKHIYKQSYNSFVSGNWEDRNIGSIYQPLYYSDACKCGNE